MEFKSFKESLEQPFTNDKSFFDILDYAKMGVPEQLHIILTGVLDFYE